MGDSVNQVVEDLLNVLRAQPLDTVWTSFDSGDGLLAEVERIADRIQQGDGPARAKLTLLFAPTGALQETALLSGFSDQYMRLAARLDHLG